MPHPWLTRFLLAVSLAVLLVLCVPAHRLPADVRPAGWASAADSARQMCGKLTGQYPEAITAGTRTTIEQVLHQANNVSEQRRQLLSSRDSLSAAALDAGLDKLYREFADAVRKLDAALAGDASLVRFPGATVERNLELNLGSGALVVSRRRDPRQPPVFTWRRVDLTAGAREQTVELPPEADYYAVLELVNAPAGSGEYLFHVGAGTLKVKLTVPPQYPARVTILGPGGMPTEAAVGLYSADGRLLAPDSALDFGSAGYSYAPVNWRKHGQVLFWPGTDRHLSRCFFVKGGFTIRLPAGSYRLIASKGPEYLPADTTLEVSAGAGVKRQIQLKRWVDMPAKGWYSGDCHIHYERASRAANRPLLLWARAEDLWMNNILRMGDARETYFEQYAWGARGRLVTPAGAIVPGQEDPRTAIIGHTIQLNLQQPVRDPEHYYLYSNIFDQTHRQGGLTGYAHVNADLFHVHRDMSLNIPLGKADFAEICEFGSIKTDLWYEFLNLGFKLPAAAGSDAPWGGTIGDSRVYVYTGGAFNPDRWFDGLRRGQTFVTLGPMLELTVNGKLPGDEIRLQGAGALRIHASASAGYLNQPMQTLEIVVNGVPVRKQPVEKDRAGLDFTLPLKHSAWIAARVNGAHTSPVYVTVAGQRHWARERVAELVAVRENQLVELEHLLDQPDPTGRGWRGGWESRQAWLAGKQRLREQIAKARAVYQRLQSEAAVSR